MIRCRWDPVLQLHPDPAPLCRRRVGPGSQWLRVITEGHGPVADQQFGFPKCCLWAFQSSHSLMEAPSCTTTTITCTLSCAPQRALSSGPFPRRDWICQHPD